MYLAGAQSVVHISLDVPRTPDRTVPGTVEFTSVVGGKFAGTPFILANGWLMDGEWMVNGW